MPRALYEPRVGLPLAVCLGIGIALAVIGILIGWNLYNKHADTGELLTGEKKVKNSLYQGSQKLWGVDGAFTWLGVNFGGSLADAWAWFDRSIVDGMVNLVAGITRVLSEIFRRTQGGFVRGYALVMLGGVVIVVGAILWPIIAR